MTAVFAIRNGRIAQLFLGLDNFIDLLVLDGNQFRLLGIASLEGDLGLQKLLRAQKRTKMLSTEWRALVKFGNHCEEIIEIHYGELVRHGSIFNYRAATDQTYLKIRLPQCQEGKEENPGEDRRNKKRGTTWTTLSSHQHHFWP